MTAQEIRSYSIVLRTELQTYLTLNEGAFTNGQIGFHPLIKDEITVEIEDLVGVLEEFLENKYEEKMDYHLNSKKYCHALSSMFVLASEGWKLVQGMFRFENSNRQFYHSWVEKNDIIFDPAMNLVTLKSLYEQFFTKVYEYNKEELINLFKRTSIFTYYEEDLERGLLNPLGYQFLYDTNNAYVIATNFLTDLNQFLEQKSKNCNSSLNN